ncbi:MAG: hypothetical protein V1644_03300, partial [Candidatus Micrarchaeota archaeon]
MTRKVIAVIQVMRHTRNIGQETTAAGAALAFRRGEQTAAFLQRSPHISRAIRQRGLIYAGHPSHQGRAIQTEEQHYQGLVSNAFIRKHKQGGFTRQLRNVTDVGKTPEGMAQYTRDVAGLIPSIERLLQGKPQPHYAEDLSSVQRRIGIVKDIEDAIRTSSKRKAPVLFMNVVSHSLDPFSGPVELIAEQLTGKKITELGGAFKHSEGIRRVLYSDGSTETRVFRQNSKRNR